MKLGYLKQLILEAYVEVLSEKKMVYAEAEKDPINTGGKPVPTLPDNTDIILTKFSTLKHAVIKLQGDDFKEFVSSVEWISPRPSVFRVNLQNGQSYTLKWLGKGFEAQVMGKRYYINSLTGYQQALDKLVELYKEGPMTGAGVENEMDKVPDFGDSSGVGNFPGTDIGKEPATPGGGTDIPPEEEEEDNQDLSGEEVDFEKPEEEPK